MDANYMTPAQLRELADRKETEAKVKKTGQLKCDLYHYRSQDRYSVFRFAFPPHGLFTKKEIDDLVKEFRGNFECVLKKGTKFECYIVDDRERWFDAVNWGIEEASESYASEYLENIKEV